MLSIERQEEILEILKNNKSATVETLSKSLFVSAATIRRDLREMEKQSLIKRSHGGAMIFQSSSDESAIVIREQENVAEKRSIANLAVKLIQNGYNLFLDSSTTVGFVIPLFNRFNYLSATTTGLKNALLLSATNNVKIYIAGGLIASHSNSITGTDTMDYITRIHADLTLVSCSGFDLKAGFTDPDVEQAKLKRQMRKNSDKLAMLCDSTKIGKKFMCSDFTLSEIDYLITDKPLPKEYAAAAKKAGCTVLYPEN
ncbi:MAG: DeoR/GlpR family DNA-binding transcription regulator [Clostridia bacterium]|nr:DeoR/GlpR family DNA-binding transcription regulator [Clostridia bacterium]